MRTAADERSAPKYAHVERERRWLVDEAVRPVLAARPFVRIEDRYIENSRLRLRRMTDSATGETALKLGKKYEADDPLARPIVTTYLTEAEFALLAALPALPLTKRRYAMADAGSILSVDLFEGPLDGLALAEIEWPDDAGLRALASPTWALRDVTTDPRFEGGSLARNGYSQESSWPSF